VVEHFIQFLERDIKDWEDAAQFYEEHIYSVRTTGKEVKSEKQEAEKFRARIEDRKSLIAATERRIHTI
jgi:hypothetical protein